MLLDAPTIVAGAVVGIEGLIPYLLKKKITQIKNFCHLFFPFLCKNKFVAIFGKYIVKFF